MIAGRDYEISSIGALQKQEWKNTHTGGDPKVADEVHAYIYYKWIFENLLYLHGDKYFQNHKDEQADIVAIEADKFLDAMYYAELKGHQTAFEVLLNPATVALDEDFFRQPPSLPAFIFWMDSKMPKETLEFILDKDNVHQLITYTRRNFENMRDIILECAEIFFKKGEASAFEQVRQNLVGVEYDTPHISTMTNSPLNRPFRVTPAFLAKFKFEAPYVEQWDIVWDESYGKEYYANLVATMVINQFTVAQVKDYRNSNINSYKMIYDYLDTDTLPDTDKVYLAEIKWQTGDLEAQPRFIYPFEFVKIRENIAYTLSRMLETDSRHLMVAY